MPGQRRSRRPRLPRPRENRGRRPLRPGRGAPERVGGRARRRRQVHRPGRDDRGGRARHRGDTHGHRVPLPAVHARPRARGRHRRGEAGNDRPGAGRHAGREGEGGGRADRRPPPAARLAHTPGGSGRPRRRQDRTAALHLRQRQGLLRRLRRDEHRRPHPELRHQAGWTVPQRLGDRRHERPLDHAGGRRSRRRAAWAPSRARTSRQCSSSTTT